MNSQTRNSNALQFSKELKVWESEQHAAKQDAGRIRQERLVHKQ